MISITDLKKFITTRYQGNKRKMLPWLYKNLKELEFNSVLKYIYTIFVSGMSMIIIFSS